MPGRTRQRMSANRPHQHRTIRTTDSFLVAGDSFLSTRFQMVPSAIVSLRFLLSFVSNSSRERTTNPRLPHTNDEKQRSCLCHAHDTNLFPQKTYEETENKK